MPYVSNEERERQKWMTLKEAVSHVQHVDACDEETAVKDLRAALADGAVEVRWANETPTQLFVVPVTKAARRVRNTRKRFWLTVPMNLNGGGSIAELWLDELFAKDVEGAVEEEDGHTHRRYFIFVLKDQIVKLLKGQELEKTGKRQPEASDDEIIDALRDTFKDIENGKIKKWDRNMVHKWVEERVEPKRAPRKKVLNLIDKTPEFAKYKRDRGRPSEKKLESSSRGK
jgi:hypothetical protein